jgi:uncharacterized protein YndB with AHSA1/START domain
MIHPSEVTATVRIAASPEDIFPYLIDPQLIVRWIGNLADLDPVPGGTLAIDFGATKAQGEYVSVDPPHRVVFTWGIPGDEALPPGSSTVEIVLTADGNETTVDLVHRGLPADRRTDHRDGWNHCLDVLAGIFGERSAG